jgi:sugar phosphate isomerase/epimerase
MKIAFMTLGCPDWDLDTIITKGAEYGFDGVDFRGVQGELDITKMPAFTTDLEVTSRRIADAGLEVSGISSSLHVCDPGKLESNLEEARRTIPVALGLDAKRVRVFGEGNIQELGREKAADAGRECMEQILALDGARSLEWNFETHDSWINPRDCKLLLDRVPDPAFGALWDLGHTYRIAKVPAKEAYAVLGPRFNYTHVKDAVYEPGQPGAGKDGWRFVDPGTGELKLAEAIGILRKNGYDGWLLFEHEKRWHRDLPEPEAIFPKYVSWIRPLIS